MGIMRKVGYLVLGALVVAACGGAGTGARTPDPLAGTYVLKGGGGAMDAIQSLTTAFSAKHPGVVWQIEDVGSDAGVALTLSNQIDLGFISRELKEAETGTVASLSIGFSATGVAVNAANPVKALTKDQVLKIFTGQITDWKDVGGNVGKIRVLVREPDSSTRSAFEAYFFKDKAAYSKDAIEVFEIEETIKAVSSFKDSIGMMTVDNRTFSIAEIRLLAIDGVAATRENVSSGIFPIRRSLYAVYNAEQSKVKPAIKALLDFIKTPEGRKAIGAL